MKAIILNEPGGAENLAMATVDPSAIRDNEVLIQIKAISINPIDIKTRTGKGLFDMLKGEMPLILGWDVSGVVTKIGAEVSSLKPGDEVFGMVNFPGRGKAYAEYVAAPANHLALKPAITSHQEAAATTLAALTAYQSIVHYAKVKKGQRVLIPAASGGVGHFTVQIAKYLGAYVIGTSSGANRDFVLSLGANEHIDHQTVQFENVVTDVDLVLDTLGGINTERSLKVVKKGGTVVSIITGSSAIVADMAKEMGINCYNVSVKSNGDDMKELAELLSDGVLKAHISRTFGFDEMIEAHRQIESGRTVGKIVVTL